MNRAGESHKVYIVAANILIPTRIASSIRQPIASLRALVPPLPLSKVRARRPRQADLSGARPALGRPASVSSVVYYIFASRSLAASRISSTI